MKRAMEDGRFAVARTDPRFRPMRRKDAKLALDSRFTPMLTDPMFGSLEALVDRRRKKSSSENPMTHYYLNQEDVDNREKKKKPIREEQEEEESSSSDDDEEDDDDGQYSVGNDIDHDLMKRHDDIPPIVKETHRLAVLHMDWDHIKAVDMYMVMTSCVPKDGQVLSVSVYPTKFGLKYMDIERTQGPSALIGADGDVGDNDDSCTYGNNDDENDIDDGEEDSDLDSETEINMLRTYGVNRLRYYAVVVCDCTATANRIYMILDSTEFLHTENVFELQFIPDSWEFKCPARDVVTEAPLSYKVSDFDKILRWKYEDEFDDMPFNDDDSIDESLPNGVAKIKLTYREKLALLPEGNKSDEERSDGDREDIKVKFNTEVEYLSKCILERKSIETKTVWGMHQEKMKWEAKKRWSKDDVGYDAEDNADERSDEEVKPMKKQKVRAKGKGKDKHQKEHYEPEATKELDLLVSSDQDAANGAKSYNIKRKSKKFKDSVEDKLAEIDLSKDERSVRKQAGKKNHLWRNQMMHLLRRPIRNAPRRFCRLSILSRGTLPRSKKQARVKQTLFTIA